MARKSSSRSAKNKATSRNSKNQLGIPQEDMLAEFKPPQEDLSIEELKTLLRNYVEATKIMVTLSEELQQSMAGVFMMVAAPSFPNDSKEEALELAVRVIKNIASKDDKVAMRELADMAMQTFEEELGDEFIRPKRKSNNQPNQDYESFGDMLSDVMDMKNLTIDQLAKKTKLSKDRISLLIADLGEPTEAEINVIQNALGIFLD